MERGRRDFMKATTAATTGLVLATTKRAHAAWPASGSMAINPNISNMRVVSCHDTAMLKSTPTSMTFAKQNESVDVARVQANLDALAVQLANVATPEAAWSAILRSSKPWSSTRVAIKVNTLEPKNMPRIAIVQKFCDILRGFGVPAANIVIYDGCTGAADYPSYFSLTDSSKIQAVVSQGNDALGGTVSASIPNRANANCTANIADGTIDIIINLAVNKGHGDDVGGATLTMKNHFGTFDPQAGHASNILDYLLNINKSEAIVGGTYPRQQLCVVDSLLAMKNGPSGTPDVMPCYLTMGVFAPAVDYLTIKKVREEVMGRTHNNTAVESFLTSFGYATSDPIWIVVPPASGGSGGTGGSTGAGGSNGSGGALNRGGGNPSSGGASASGGASNNRGGSNPGNVGDASTAAPGTGGEATHASGSGGSGTTGAAGLGSSSGARDGSTATAPGSEASVGVDASTSGGPSSPGSGCQIGRAEVGLDTLATMLTVGAVVAAPLRRIINRREELASERSSRK